MAIELNRGHDKPRCVLGIPCPKCHAREGYLCREDGVAVSFDLERVGEMG